MLHHGGMHESYWTDAILTAVYLLNRCIPSSKQVTRYEAWTGQKQKFSLKHLRVFGCDVYRHVLKDQRSDKISTTSSIGAFVAYDEEKNGYYKIWDVQEQKLYRTRDAIFNESCGYSHETTRSYSIFNVKDKSYEYQQECRFRRSVEIESTLCMQCQCHVMICLVVIMRVTLTPHTYAHSVHGA